MCKNIIKRFSQLALISCCLVFLPGFALFDAVKSGVQNLSDGLKGAFVGKMSYIIPPQGVLLKNAHRIKFESVDAESIKAAQAFGDYMSELKVDNKPYFVTSDSIEPEIIVKVKVNTQRDGERSFTEQRMQCPGSGYIRKCSSSEARYYNVYCRERGAWLDTTITVTNIKANSVLIERTENEEATSKACSDSSSSDMLSVEQLMSRNISKIVDKVFAGQVPVIKRKPSDLFKRIEGVSDSDQEYLAQSKELAESGNVSQAIRQYEELVTRYSDLAELKYNLAICKESIGDFIGARSLYEAAYPKLLDKQEDIRASVATIDGFIRSGYTKMM